jgi:hypothetical protein
MAKYTSIGLGRFNRPAAGRRKIVLASNQRQLAADRKKVHRRKERRCRKPFHWAGLV